MGFERYVLVTGGAGFIGSHLVRYLVRRYRDWGIVVLDALTYAGNLENLSDVLDAPNCIFVHGDIRDSVVVEGLFRRYGFWGVFHVAAESHVDRSIYDPVKFAEVNVVGTVVLLSVAMWWWRRHSDRFHRFLLVSTDEVYGSLGEEGVFTEESPYNPRSPYAASKAGGDMFAHAFFHTYGFPVVVTHSTNNFGPYQFPEKLIPLTILHFAEGKPVPVYGTGENVRDWIWVEDHVRALDVVFQRGEPGGVYHISAHNEWRNIDVVHAVGKLVDAYLGRSEGTYRRWIRFVADRPGHDFRYALRAERIRGLGWRPQVSFLEGLKRTVEWYLTHREWVDRVRSGAYRQYLKRHYSALLGSSS